jgi:hypothetical protein
LLGGYLEQGLSFGHRHRARAAPHAVHDTHARSPPASIGSARSLHVVYVEAWCDRNNESRWTICSPSGVCRATVTIPRSTWPRSAFAIAGRRQWRVAAARRSQPAHVPRPAARSFDRCSDQRRPRPVPG